jgi:hypothetical protein
MHGTLSSFVYINSLLHTRDLSSIVELCDYHEGGNGSKETVGHDYDLEPATHFFESRYCV